MTKEVRTDLSSYDTSYGFTKSTYPGQPISDQHRPIVNVSEGTRRRDDGLKGLEKIEKLDYRITKVSKSPAAYDPATQAGVISLNTIKDRVEKHIHPRGCPRGK